MSHKPRVAGRDNDLLAHEQLCAAAMQCFAADGLASASLRSIAAKAGVSVGYIQNRFGTKNALIDAVNEQLRELICSAFASSPPRPDSSPERWISPLVTLMHDTPAATDYLCQLLLADHPAGRALFDQLVVACDTQSRNGSPDLLDDDVAGAAVTAVVCTLGALLTRRQWAGR